MKACNCNLSLSNLGTTRCKDLMGVPRKLIFVPTYADDGTRNKIPTGATLNLAYFTALINQADASKRWYPTPIIDNVENARETPVMENLNSGKKIFIQQGVRTFSCILVEETAALLAKLESISCNKVSVYVVDALENIIGISDGTDIYPIMLENSTFYPELITTTDSTSQKIKITFEFANTEQDSDLQIITSTEAGCNPLLFDGLLDVNVAAATSKSTTGFVTSLTTDYGTFDNPIVVSGWVKADFALYNVTDAAPVTITTATETPDGTYTFVFAAQTSADVLRLTSTLNGFEFPATTVTIP